VKDILDEILSIIWGSKNTKKKTKQPRDKKGRYTKRSKK
tara:strand:+ start:136 stop:252 length:117 start_codon:yes stop_codon:yes gene_type:complete